RAELASHGIPHGGITHHLTHTGDGFRSRSAGAWGNQGRSVAHFHHGLLGPVTIPPRSGGRNSLAEAHSTRLLPKAPPVIHELRFAPKKIAQHVLRRPPVRKRLSRL